tara:strand:+ start:4125 stop:4967 length:843 start_codon:yes stop_codon:yes gene_type:complete
MYYGLSKLEFGISIVLIIYILGTFDTPIEFLHVFKSPLTGIAIFGLLIYLFYNAHVILTVLYIFAIYELLKRANEYNYDDIIENDERKKQKEEAFFNMIEGLEDDEVEGLLEGFNDAQIEDIIEGFNEGELDEELEGFENEEDLLEGFENEEDLLDGFENADDMDANSVVNPTDVDNAVADLAESSNLGSSDELQNTEALQNAAAAQSQLSAALGQGEVGTSDASGSATVTEAFTQLLGVNSLENEMVNNMAPVGLGTRINYKTTPYVSSSTDVKGASLV